MPELSDVEGFRRYFARYAAGRRIESVRAEDATLLRNTTPQALGRSLSGRRFARPERHGKWLIAPTDGDPAALFHFGMTGLLAWTSNRSGHESHPHDRVVFRLEGGVLCYRNMRKLGGVWLATSSEERDAVLGGLGPDALGVTAEQLAELLAGRRGGVKAALMDQALLAGLGNLLTDEVLWRARINPRCPAAELGRSRVARLHECMREVLGAANRKARVPTDPGWLTGARDQREPRCPRCEAGLKRGTVAGRTSAWCPRCQRR